MKIFNKFSTVSVLAFAIVFSFAGSQQAHAFASPGVIDLGGASDFSILTYAGVTDGTPASTHITGNVGVSPTTGASITDTTCSSIAGGGKIYEVDSGYAVTGFAACAMPGDITPANKTLVDNAIGFAGTAYTDGNSRAVDATNIGSGSGTWDLAGLTIAPGVYSFSGPGNVVITNDVHLIGSATDVWIFKVPGTLDISSAKKILLGGGAQSSNVYWIVGGATTLETTSTFEGNILDQTSVALLAGATLDGRAFSNTASVTLNGSTVSIPVYVTPSPVGAHGGGPLVSQVPILPPSNPVVLPAAPLVPVSVAPLMAPTVSPLVPMTPEPADMGCLSGNKFSTTTGHNCVAVSATSSTVLGCSLGNKFSTLSGNACSSFVPNPTPMPVISNFGQTIKSIATNLNFGSKGNPVKILQQFLISQDKGPMAKALGAHILTTNFGSLTKAALAEWQKAVGINPASGNFGPMTRAFLNSNY